MKVKVIRNSDLSMVGRVFDVVYYDYDSVSGRVVFKAYDGRPVELYAGEVRIIFEDLRERLELERYVYEKAFKDIWG